LLLEPRHPGYATIPRTNDLTEGTGFDSLILTNELARRDRGIFPFAPYLSIALLETSSRGILACYG